MPSTKTTWRPMVDAFLAIASTTESRWRTSFLPRRSFYHPQSTITLMLRLSGAEANAANKIPRILCYNHLHCNAAPPLQHSFALCWGETANSRRESLMFNAQQKGQSIRIATTMVVVVTVESIENEQQPVEPACTLNTIFNFDFITFFNGNASLASLWMKGFEWSCVCVY